MERLQAAIEKARQERPEDAVGSVQRSDLAVVPSLWSGLPELHLNPALMRRNRLFAFEASPQATPFDILRTRTLRQMQQNGWRRLAITSPTPGCGKSTIALNLAFALARQPRTRTIQIELDMRRPGQRGFLGLPKNRGKGEAVSASAQLLTGQVSFSDVAERVGDKLAMVTSEVGVANASDVLLGQNVPDVLAQIEADYQPDITVFDMPPMLVNDDMMAFTRHVDCVLIVAAAEQTSVQQIDKCERDLAEQTNVLGVTLNKCHFRGRSGGYSYDYDYSS